MDKPGLVALLWALADPERLALAGWFAGQRHPATLADAASSLGTDPARTQKVATSLVATGVLTRTPEGLTYDPTQARDAAAFALADQPFGRLLPQHPRLQNIARTGVITHLPAQRDLVVELVDAVMQELPPFDTLTEPELNEVLGEFTTDIAMLRRLLVDEERLGRSADGTDYWRMP